MTNIKEIKNKFVSIYFKNSVNMCGIRDGKISIGAIDVKDLDDIPDYFEGIEIIKFQSAEIVAQ